MWNTGAEDWGARRLYGYQGCNTEAVDMVNRSAREWEGLYRYLRETAASLRRHAAPAP